MSFLRQLGFSYSPGSFFFFFYLKSVDYRLTYIGVFNSEVFSLKSEAVIAGLITCTGWIFLEITFSRL